MTFESIFLNVNYSIERCIGGPERWGCFDETPSDA